MFGLGVAEFLLGLDYECGLLCLGCFSWVLVWVCGFVCFLCVFGIWDLFVWV